MAAMNNRGAVHSLEAFFAAIIIFTALLYSNSVSTDKDQRLGRPLDAIGMEALISLNNDGAFGRLVEGRHWDDVENMLKVAFPAGMSFNLTVFDDAGVIVNNRTITNGGLTGRTISSVEYLLVVESSSCPLYRLRLQLGV